MANETVYSGLSHPTDVFSDAMSAALIESVVVLPLIYSEDIPTNTAVKKVEKDSYLTASSGGVSEGADYTTLSQYTRTGVSITAIKDVVSSFVTIEAKKFGRVDEAFLARKQGEALARALDDELLALFTGFTGNVQTATSVLTVNDCLEAVYKVRAATKLTSRGKLRAVIGLKGHFAIQKELVASGASAFTVPSNLSILGDSVDVSGFVGSLPGLDVFVVGAGLPTSGGDEVGLVFEPSMALAGMYDPSPMTTIINVGKGNPSFGTEVSSVIFHGAAEWNDQAGCQLKSDS